MNNIRRFFTCCAFGLFAAVLAVAESKRPPQVFTTRVLEWGEVRFQAKYKGTVYPIRLARGDEPAVILPTGKVVKPVLDSMELVPVGPANAQTRPDWLYIDTLKAEHSSATDINAGGSFNHELDLRFVVEATKPLPNVFLVAFVTTQRGPRGLLVQEVGDLAAFSRREVDFQLRLAGDFGAMNYRIYAFSDGRELRQPLRTPDGFTPAVAQAVKGLQAASSSALPVPYLCFPPRGLNATTGSVNVDVSINSAGAVTTLVVDPALPDLERRKIADAVRYWWFVPGRGPKGDNRFRIEIDLSDLKNWNDQCVRVLQPELAATDSGDRKRIE